jgi:GT2 family glycosyltransferase/glycosyltransferase involved in cell wall biosynthesis
MIVEDNNLEDWDIIVVTFNSADALANSWSDAPVILRDRVICVDNSSTDNTVAIASSLFPTVLSHSNDGLSVANNFGATHGGSKYLLFANPDLVPRPEDFREIMTHLDKHGGLVAPRLIGADSKPQENARGWPTLTTQILNRLIPSLVHSYRWPSPSGGAAEVPWVIGAAIAMTRDTFIELGGWPEEYFLYYEDVVLAMRAHSLQLSVSLLESVRWHHGWARSSHKLLSRSTFSHLHSAIRFFTADKGLLRDARSTFEASLSRQAEDDTSPSSIRVDFIVRSDSASKGGGDLIQAQKTAAELDKLGLKVTVRPFSLDYRPEPGAIVHVFNVDRPFELLWLKRFTPYSDLVVSPIHHAQRLVRQMRQSENGDSVLERLAARLPEDTRELLLFSQRSIKDSSSWWSSRLYAVVWATLCTFRLPTMLARSLSNSRAVVLLSKKELNDLREDLGYSGDNHILAPNGLEPITVSIPAWKDRGQRILVVGRIEPRKRQLEILRAANTLNVPITFVGGANKNRSSYFSRFYNEINNGTSSYLGELAHSDVLHLMANSRVVLNFSWVEVQSLVDLEAASLGCYIVVSRSGSTKEWLGESAKEFESDDIDQAVISSMKLVEGTTPPPPFEYTQTWEDTARQLAELYIEQSSSFGHPDSKS